MSQGYDSNVQVDYQFVAMNFVTGAGTYKLPIPRSSRFARIMDILVIASTTFTQVTTAALVQVGDGVTPNAFAQLSVGGLTSGNSISGRDLSNQYGVWISNYIAQANPAVGVNGVLHDLVMTIVAPTGGTPAGVGTIYVLVEFDQINRSPQQ